MKFVYIIVLNWNGWKDAIECLESLLCLTYPHFRIIVIDNHSTNNSVNYIKSWAQGNSTIKPELVSFCAANKMLRIIDYDRETAEAGGLPDIEESLSFLSSSQYLILIQTGANLGYAGGNNVGIKYSLKKQADYIWILNNDTVVDKNALSEMVSAAKTDEQIGMVGSKLFYYDQPTIIQAAGGGYFSFWKGFSHHCGLKETDNGQWGQVFEPDYLTGSSLLIRNEVINSIGFMDETFFLYGEELEWQIRAKNHGWKLVYCPTSILWHKESASLSDRKPVIDFYTTSNWLRVVKRYKVYALPTAVCFQILRALHRFAYGKPQQACAVIKGIWRGLTS
jgi:GT2 family glycosyltransferase